MTIEEHEEIPWSMLVEQDRHGRRRTLYLAAAAIVAVVVGFTGIRFFEGQRHGEDTAGPAPTATTAAAAVRTTTTTLLSEADLMAVDPTTMALAAVARAEWFVTDYFTVDGSPLVPAGEVPPVEPLTDAEVLLGKVAAPMAVPGPGS